MLRRTAVRIGIAGIVAGFTAAVPQAALADPGVEGSWSSLQSYPIVPVSMGVMPDGKIVAWDQANKPPNFPNIPNNGPAMILDPQTGQVTRSANVAPRTTFCSLIATLPDGKLAIIGGGSDSGGGATRDVQIYDGDSKTFSVLGQMNQRRWYPGGTIDRDGNMVVAGGTSTGVEEMNQLTGASATLDSTFRANWYPDLVRMANGNFLIEDVGDNAVAGPGRFMLSGTSLSTVSNTTQLKTRRRGVRTLIGPHTMFYNSGGTSRESMIIDASSGTPTFTQVASSDYPHMTGQALTLPTGDVLAVGGNSSGNDTKGTPVMTPELYSVATNNWTDMADMARRRTYHSVAALLPDGRVWSAGSSFDEVQEPNGQFFSPPYLYRKDGTGQPATRPSATGAPSTVAAGQPFSIATGNPSDIAYASFIRMAGTTHQVNAGQAFVKLPVSVQSGRVGMVAPSVDQAPPGYYMVFLVSKSGVPSIAPVVRMYPTSSTAPQPRVVQSSQYDVSTPASNAFDGNVSQGPGSKISHTLEEPQPWWQVDLGESKDLDSVTVRLRGNCCTDRNRDLWVFASDQPFNSTTVAGLQAQPGVSAVRLQTPDGDVNVAALDRTARYIRVQHPGTGFLHLAEVTPNEAGVPSPPLATQSTTNVSSDVSRGAGRALDGNANGSMAAGYMSETKTQNEPWWQVDLGRERDLGNVRVDMRTDCCTDRTRDVWVFTSKTPFTSNTVAGTLAQPGVSAVRMQTPTGTVGNAAINATGRYVRIQSPAQATSLALAEVSFTDNKRPSVSVTAPANGASFTAPAGYSFSANASDPDGQVTKVEFFRGSTLVGTDTGAPFSVNDAGVPAGTYSLTAKATDSGGAVTTSSPVSITVQQAAPSGPVAAYAFDEGSGPTLTDRTGNGHNGAILGADWTTQGHSGRALSFDGGTDMVTVPDHASLDLTNAFTIESWVKPDSLNDWRMVLLKEAPPSTLAYGLYASSNGARQPSAWTQGGVVLGPGSTSVGAWTHLATTYENGTMRLYVNGQLVASNSSVPASQPSSGPLRIGGTSIWASETFDGLIDDVRIYGRALSAAEIQTDRDTPVADPPDDGPQPALELTFGEGAGSVAQDTSGNDHDGGITGAAWTTQGHNGNALSFDGVDDRVTVPDHADLDLGSTFTIESWIKPDTLAGWRTAVLKEAPPNTLSYGLYASADGGPIPNAWTAGGAVLSPEGLTVGAWSHLATTYDNGTMRIYINRQLVATQTGIPAPPASAGPLQIGGNSIWDFEDFDGLIDDVRIYREALAPDEFEAGASLSGAPAGSRVRSVCVTAKGTWAQRGKLKRATCTRR